MIQSIDTMQVFNRIQRLFPIKTLTKLGIVGNFFSLIMIITKNKMGKTKSKQANKQKTQHYSQW